MSLTNHADVALVGTEDMATCFEVVSKSFGHDAPFMDIYFPNHDTPSGQLQGSNRLTAWRRSTENSVFLKAVTSIEGDPANKQRIMGFAIWTHMKDIPPQKLENAENVEEIWPDVNDRKFMAAMWEEYVKPRTQAVRDSHGKGVYGEYLTRTCRSWYILLGSTHACLSSRAVSCSPRLPTPRCW